ncbi:hypothetical protein LX32DRAFT_114950 [Colletotrichum zoysiae]|uniref:Uncharacterized protein n=1 Tax=Colletotrichum zoysiae TaxID=1216348 RepID=A0AAD9LWU6_9PEZI|nr:hypothetical protein LX32DRAFT_114950 [Colletotrichum zoysiae]
MKQAWAPSPSLLRKRLQTEHLLVHILTFPRVDAFLAPPSSVYKQSFACCCRTYLGPPVLEANVPHVTGCTVHITSENT